MKKLLTAVSLVMAMGVVAPVIAGELQTVKGKTQGRENHSFIYEDKDACKTCHVNPMKSTTDAACVECHGNINEIELDVNKLVNPHANPHASVHYGDAISCISCHSEHKPKAPVCTECHRTWFKEM